MKLIKIYSKTCGPCKVLEKNLVESGVDYDSVDVASEEGEDIVEKYGVNVLKEVAKLNFSNTDRILKEVRK